MSCFYLFDKIHILVFNIDKFVNYKKMRKIAVLFFQLVFIESFKNLTKNEREKYYFDPLDINNFLHHYFLVVSLNFDKDKIFLRFNSESSIFDEEQGYWFKLDGIPKNLREKGIVFSLEKSGPLFHFYSNK